MLSVYPAYGQLRVYPQRIPAPSLSGAGEWVNTAAPLELQQLRGKFVLLDFWTYCCINCMHVLPELKKLERAYPQTLVVIGVHSAKFTAERQTDSIRQAVQRYEIEHPVVNDGELILWRKYQINMWPSLRVIDPEGNLIAGHEGEIRFEHLDRFFRAATASYARRGLLPDKPLAAAAASPAAQATPLRFPGKVLADAAGGRLLIADSGHNRIVVAGLDGTLREVIGNGQIGRRDGDFATASFDHPQGLALEGDDLYVADTENHLIRQVSWSDRRVTTIAGTGQQARAVPPRSGSAPRAMALASPWDLWLHQGDLYIAMAGTHQLWKLDLRDRTLGPYAGNGVEDVVDGSRLPLRPYQLGYASFAQPSGLASDGKTLFIADSEGSSLRALPWDPRAPVTTLVGTAALPTARLFTFGDRDGAAAEALLQHPVGLAYDRGSLYVADTYNNKIKRVALGSPPRVTTLAGGTAGEFFEPCGLSVAGDKLYVADTNHHRIRVIDLGGNNAVSTLEIAGLQPPTSEPPPP